MARNKHSTALFDVIHATKKPPRSSPSASIPAPRWWGKDKKPSKPAVADATENVGKQQSWLTAARRNGGVAPLVAPVVSEAQPVIESREPVPPADVELNQSDAEVAVQSEPAVPKTRFLDRFKSRAVLAETVVEESAIEVETVEPIEKPGTQGKP